MGFRQYANRVRDTSLAHGRRITALRSAVSRYAPLGFNATWAYICAAATTDAEPKLRIRRDEAVLLRALDLLESSRSSWLEDQRSFAARRRREKAAGRRTPRRSDMERLQRVRWPGAGPPSANGLVEAVRDRLAELATWPLPEAADGGPDLGRARLQVVVMECAARYERDGALDAAGSARLRAAIAELSAGLREGFSELNSWHLWMLRVAELVEFAAGGRR